jgi:nitrogen fixation NifU-like protein
MNSATDELRDIYRKRVLDHSRAPHNCRRPDAVDREASGFNPLCGDKLTVYMQIQSGAIQDVSFEGAGCAISVASASMMTDALKGNAVANADRLISEVQQMFTEGTDLQSDELTEIEALMSVRRYPSRIKCATLAWSAATAALHGSTSQITTE